MPSVDRRLPSLQSSQRRIELLEHWNRLSTWRGQVRRWTEIYPLDLASP